MKIQANDSIKVDAFIEVVQNSRSHDDEQSTIHELIEKIRIHFLLTDIKLYGFTYMKNFF